MPEKFDGNIPVLVARGKGLPDTWEKSLMLLWEKGTRIKTEHDKPEDPPSKDCKMIMVIDEPLSKPRVHKMGMIGYTPEVLEEYRQEFVEGTKDWEIKPEEGKWPYTYHQRLKDYSPEKDLTTKSSTLGKLSSKLSRYLTKKIFKPVNQIDYIVDKLSKSGYSRRAQATTWMPTADPKTDFPPCLQRVWCRIFRDYKERPVLNMNTSWRSRDALKAAFMNLWGTKELEREIAERISENIGEEVKVGQMVDDSDSYHGYGRDFEMYERFLKTAKSRPMEEKVWEESRVDHYLEKGRKKLMEEKQI